jgi:hypothetical protein
MKSGKAIANNVANGFKKFYLANFFKKKKKEQSFFTLVGSSYKSRAFNQRLSVLLLLLLFAVKNLRFV